MKSCGSCGETKGTDEFGVRDAKTNREHTVCRECRRGYCRDYYHKDPEAFNARKRERMAVYRERARHYVERFLSSHPCVDCGADDLVVLEFDHVRGVKRKAVAVMVWEGVSVQTLAAEIRKCVVRCADCHRRTTATTRGYWKTLGKDSDEDKSQ